MLKNSKAQLTCLLLSCFCLGCESEKLAELKNEIAQFKRQPLPAVKDVSPLSCQVFSYGSGEAPCPFTQKGTIEEKNQVIMSPSMTEVGRLEKGGKTWILLEDDSGSIHVVSGEQYMHKQQRYG